MDPAVTALVTQVRFYRCGGEIECDVVWLALQATSRAQHAGGPEHPANPAPILPTQVLHDTMQQPAAQQHFNHPVDTVQYPDYHLLVKVCVCVFGAGFWGWSMGWILVLHYRVGLQVHSL